MMPIPANQVTHCEVKLFGLISSAGSSSKNTVNTFHFRRTTVVNPLSKAHIDTAFQAAIAAKVLLALTLRWAQTFNTVRFLNDATDAPGAFAHANPGAIAGDSMPASNYVYTLLQSGLRGKSYRGNYKLGPPGESATTVGTDDILNAGAITYFGNVASAVLGGFTDADGNIWVPSIVSKKLSQLAINPTFVFYSDVTTIKVNKRVSEMKRRKVASAY